MDPVVLDQSLTWRQVVEIAAGRARLGLSAAAQARLDGANAIVRSIVHRNIRAYGVNTGVGAMADQTVSPDQQAALSRNILMSHAVGSGAPLTEVETRAIMAAAINNFAHGYSGLRRLLVERMLVLLDAGCIPVVPRQGSVGYLSHMAHISLVLIGEGHVTLHAEKTSSATALARLGLPPLTLEAKEGLCLVNGTPCATGLACLVLDQASRLARWADAIAAMTFETQRCQLHAINEPVMQLRASPGLARVAHKLNALLRGSALLADAAGSRTQDALSLRSIPQVHGAVHDVLTAAQDVVARELQSVTDNPIVLGTPEQPQARSQAHAVGAAIGLTMDHMANALAQLGAISERRIDRMLNPLVSGLPAFLAVDSGVASGLMIAQYAAVSLCAENRRLAAPASLDGGITSALQEDFLCHATPAALRTLTIIDNLRRILAIEYLAACQSYDLLGGGLAPAPRTAALYRALRASIPLYADQLPLGDHMAATAAFLDAHDPDVIVESRI